MKIIELRKQHDRLQALIKKTALIGQSDMEIQSHWAKYICVLSAGFLENALHEIYSQYCANQSHTNVARYARTSLDRISNPKTGRFLDVAGNFHNQWRRDLEAFVADRGRREAVNSIMSNRHLIAHGKDSNISLARLKRYLAKSVESS